ncbi:MAG: ParB N-terminal domain-containing protein [Candidatus Methanomethylicia archaeon]|nr:ParB N-terminal domain-containing protein [Candidatus Methanomethylicia archaeon]
MKNMELNIEVKILPISTLKPHEEINFEVVRELAIIIKKEGIFRRAIAIDKENYIILDGHHRVKALEILGCRFIPCLLLDYFSPLIVVSSWNNNISLSKELIIDAGIKGKLLPPKTSKHMINLCGKLSHLSELEPEVNIPLKDLF